MRDAVIVSTARTPLSCCEPNSTKCRDAGVFDVAAMRTRARQTPGMRVMDDLDRPYVIGGAETTALGWRVQATEAHE